MGMVVRTNMAGLNANNALNMASKTQQNAMQKLASGFRINKAADDASGLSISEKMKNQIKALDTAADNCEDGANLIQTAEGYMNETHDILNRMTELAEKAANGVLDDTDRDALQDEMDQLCAEIDRMATTANFNGHKLMDGSIGSNAIIEINSSATGNSYSISTTTGPLQTRYVASGVTASSNALSELKGSAQSELISKIYSAAEAYVTATGAGAGTVDIAVNKDGDILTDPTAVTDVDTNNKYGATNKTGYSKISVTIAEETATAIRAGSSIKLQIGESSIAADKLDVKIGSFHTDTLLGGVNGFNNLSAGGTGETDVNAVAETKGNSTTSTYDKALTINITDKDKASAAADAIRQVSNYVSDERGKLGAQQNRLEHTVNNLTTASENVTAANSRIRDTNMAEEMMSYTSKNVVAQAAQAMLAQANSQPQNVLSLLQ